MTGGREYLAAALAELRKFDITPRILNGGRHRKLEWRIPGQPRRVATVSGSPSDVRGIWNFRAQIRRTLLKDGAKPRDNVRRAAPQIIAMLAPVEPLASRVERLEHEVAELQDLVVELMTKLEPAKKVETATPAPKPKQARMAELLQFMFYDRPIGIRELAAASNKPYGIVASRLHALKARGLVKQLAGRGGEWLKAPIP